MKKVIVDHQHKHHQDNTLMDLEHFYLVHISIKDYVNVFHYKNIQIMISKHFYIHLDPKNKFVILFKNVYENRSCYPH